MVSLIWEHKTNLWCWIAQHSNSNMLNIWVTCRSKKVLDNWSPHYATYDVLMNMILAFIIFHVASTHILITSKLIDTINYPCHCQNTPYPPLHHTFCSRTSQHSRSQIPWKHHTSWLLPNTCYSPKCTYLTHLHPYILCVQGKSTTAKPPIFSSLNLTNQFIKFTNDNNHFSPAAIAPKCKKWYTYSTLTTTWFKRKTAYDPHGWHPMHYS